MDVLADLLERARARGAVFAASTLHAPWGMAMAGGLPLAIHLVLAGEAWLEVDGEPPLALAAGDVALVAAGIPHRLVDRPGSIAMPIESMGVHRVPGTEGVFVVPGSGAPTSVMCGAYRFDGDICASLVSSLPTVVHLAHADAVGVHPLAAMLATEIAADAPGRSTVLDRLLDVLLVRILRIWFDRADATPPAWYRALDHPEIGRALRMMHLEPHRHWTVDSLAHEVGLSRAAFARQFNRLVGEPPLRYLSGWRMELAVEQLRESNDTIGRIARRLGYDNEFAFSTAFRRIRGESPSATRSRLRGSAISA